MADANEQFIEPTRTGRLLVVAGAFVYLAICFAVYFATHWLIVPVGASASCNELTWSIAGLAAIGAVMFWYACEALWSGWRVWSSRQLPAPGTRVLFRTLVRRGPRVRAHAAIKMTGGLLVMIAIAWVLASQPIHQLLTAPCGHP